MIEADNMELIYFKDMMAIVGYFFLCWGNIGTALDSEIIRMRGSVGADPREIPASSISNRMNEWRRLVRLSESRTEMHSASDEVSRTIESLRSHRNLIAHGLRGAYTDSFSGSAYIKCLGNEATSEAIKIYTKAELDSLVQTADRCRRALRSLPNWLGGA